MAEEDIQVAEGIDHFPPLRRIIHATCGEVCGFTVNTSDWSFQRTSQKQICCMCRGELCESNTYFDRKYDREHKDEKDRHAAPEGIGSIDF